MAASLPAALKSADIQRFAHRAQQLERVKPIVSYWCMHPINYSTIHVLTFLQASITSYRGSS